MEHGSSVQCIYQLIRTLPACAAPDIPLNPRCFIQFVSHEVLYSVFIVNLYLPSFKMHKKTKVALSNE